jgi:hypothetical protein
MLIALAALSILSALLFWALCATLGALWGRILAFILADD